MTCFQSDPIIRQNSLSSQAMADKSAANSAAQANDEQQGDRQHCYHHYHQPRRSETSSLSSLEFDRDEHCSYHSKEKGPGDTLAQSEESVRRNGHNYNVIEFKQQLSALKRVQREGQRTRAVVRSHSISPHLVSQVFSLKPLQTTQASKTLQTTNCQRRENSNNTAASLAAITSQLNEQREGKNLENQVLEVRRRHKKTITETMTFSIQTPANQMKHLQRSKRRKQQQQQQHDQQQQQATFRSFFTARFIGSPLVIGLALCVFLSRAISESGAAITSQQYFEVQPEPQYLVQNGQDVRLRCLVRNRIGECLWLRGGRAIGVISKKYNFLRAPEDGDCSLMIRNVSVQQDDGQWQCQVTSADVDQDTLQSREVQLVVLMPPERPQIKNLSQGTQRTSLILEEGKSKTVVCEMRGGNPAPQIEWYLDNKNISKEAQNNSTVGQSSSSSSSSSNGNSNVGQRISVSKLKINDVKRSMNGKNLTCVGVHQTLNQSTTVDLDVQYLPTVSVVQREYSIVEGSPLSINCQVDANPPPNIVNWRLVSDGSAMARSQQQQPSAASITLPIRPGPVLEFDSISRERNQNIFECLAQNSYGISSPADVKLNVLYAPQLVNTSNSESVSVGGQAQLNCLFDGNPEPEVKWFYTDPLSRSAVAIQLDNKRQQQLLIRNVTYRNEGDYHCEARNQINGVNYGVRSSNIQLDVFGEPQFLVKSPVQAKAIQGTKSDMAITFCADPPPNKIYWQFGSLRFDVRFFVICATRSASYSVACNWFTTCISPSELENWTIFTHLYHQKSAATALTANRLPSNSNGHQPTPQVAQTLPGGNSKQSSSVNHRFVAHPLQALQKRDTGFSKTQTCFEATLTILEPELTDQRDYTLFVQNERGHQSAVVRLRVSSPLSPMLMITSAFVTICGLFLLSLVAMFLVKRRHHGHQSAGGGAAGNGSIGAQNGMTREKNGVEHLANGNSASAAATALASAAAASAQLMQQQTRGIVNGVGNGPPNGASNPAGGSPMLHADEAKLHNMLSMASSDTSGDQKQLLTGSDRNSSASGSTATASTNHCVDYHTNSATHSTADSSPTSLNHISVDDEMHLGSTYQAAESVTHDAHLNVPDASGALIYANLDYSENSNNNQQQLHTRSNSIALQQQQHSPQQAHGVQRRQQTPIGRHSPSESSVISGDLQHQSLMSPMPSMSEKQVFHHQPASPGNNSTLGPMRPSVGATIAMMNSLAAAAAAQQTSAAAAANGSPSAGVLSGAISQQLASSRQVRKPGPPKPPKPSIQQRSRFYQQQQQQQQAGNGLVMIGSPENNNTGYRMDQSANELAVEYSRIAFPARAEL